MPADENIRAFIEQQREAGAFDSSRRFSLDLRKARQKGAADVVAPQPAKGSEAKGKNSPLWTT